MAKKDKPRLREATTEDVLDAFVALQVNSGLQKISPEMNRTLRRKGVDFLSAKRIALQSLQRMVNLALVETEAEIAAAQEESEIVE